MFLTLTAPSFGPVHSRRVTSTARRGAAGRAATARSCRARRLGSPAARSTTRTTRGSASRSARSCFDYEHAVLWNALAPELWRRTRDPDPARARAAARGHASGGCAVRVSYVKVAEFQRRGALHFHCVVRLDAAQPRTASCRAAAGRVHDAQLLIDAALAAVAARVGASPPRRDDGRRRLDAAPAREIRWGAQVEVRELDTGAARGGGVVRGLHRQVRDQDHRGGRRAHAPARRRRRRATCKVRPHVAAAGRVRVAARRRAAPAAAAAAALGAPARVPRALLHQEPPLLDDVHARCARRATSTCCDAARRRAARSVGPAVSEGACVEQRRWRYGGIGLPDARATRGSPSRGASARSSSGGSRARSFAPTPVRR